MNIVTLKPMIDISEETIQYTNIDNSQYYDVYAEYQLY